MNSNQISSNYDFTVGSVSCSATRIPIGFRRIRSGPVSDSSTWVLTNYISPLKKSKVNELCLTLTT